MNEKIYDLIENEDGTLTAVINEGVTRLEEYPFMPKLFERNENVAVLAVPSTLESVCINFPKKSKPAGSPGKSGPKKKHKREKFASPFRYRELVELGRIRLKPHPIPQKPPFLCNAAYYSTSAVCRQYDLFSAELLTFCECNMQNQF